MLQESVAQKKMPTNKQLVIPGVTKASGLDLVFQDLLMYVADAERGVKLLKLASSRSRQGLAPAGQILKLMVSTDTVPGSGSGLFLVNGFGSDLERTWRLSKLKFDFRINQSGSTSGSGLPED